ncbi:hypothetical protein G5I_07871 [Acromyrmex echinatior]|uniref:Uncharacterized protein n=1 Tax=Acromyrmex echinatior TaxID=103372 RepID=F4WPZ1_ACREC|nr:hypothetical protein G5I_07871 [Acromyrmex echinatior]
MSVPPMGGGPGDPDRSSPPPPLISANNITLISVSIEYFDAFAKEILARTTNDTCKQLQYDGRYNRSYVLTKTRHLSTSMSTPNVAMGRARAGTRSSSDLGSTRSVHFTDDDYHNFPLVPPKSDSTPHSFASYNKFSPLENADTSRQSYAKVSAKIQFLASHPDTLALCVKEQRFTGKFPEIQANDYTYDLWCLQETMVTENIHSHSNFFNFVRDIRCPGQRAIAIKKPFRFDPLDLTILAITRLNSLVLSFTLKTPLLLLLTSDIHCHKLLLLIEGLLDYVASQTHSCHPPRRLQLM